MVAKGVPVFRRVGPGVRSICINILCSCWMCHARTCHAAMKFQPDGGNGGDGGDVVLKASRECVFMCVSGLGYKCSYIWHVLVAG